MSKYFTLATDNMTSEEVQKLAKNFGKPMGFWHWLPNYWLIKDPTETLEPVKVTAMVHAINKSTRALVIEVEKRNWAALTKKSKEGLDMADWLRSDWETD